jgi:hypothetical protein
LIPDNNDIFDYNEMEQERWERLYRRMEIEEEKEDTAYGIEEREVMNNGK